MEGADAARALAVAADEIIYAIRLGCFFFACPPPCGQYGNGERVFHGAARHGFIARKGQPSSHVLAWFSLVQTSPSGRVHWVKLL